MRSMERIYSAMCRLCCCCRLREEVGISTASRLLISNFFPSHLHIFLHQLCSLFSFSLSVSHCLCPLLPFSSLVSLSCLTRTPFPGVSLSSDF
ncbi:hypothetical protein FKM82_020436 [Ascaphus truei]